MNKAYLKKNWGNILMIAFVVLLIIPQTGRPIKILINRLISFSPSTISEKEQQTLPTYNWELKDLKGEISNFSQSENKVSIVNIWATWCPPCLAEMPSLQELYNEYGDKVDFYFVASDKEEKVIKFLAKEGYELPVYFYHGIIPSSLETNSLPTTYLLDKKGKIIINKKGSADWNSKSVKKLLDKILSEK